MQLSIWKAPKEWISFPIFNSIVKTQKHEEMKQNIYIFTQSEQFEVCHNM